MATRRRRTRASTVLRWTFILTCSPRISVKGPNMLIQSFFSGVIRCGGIGIRLVSDFRDVRKASAETGSNAGAADVLGSEFSSTSIMSSSSALACSAVEGIESVIGSSSFIVSSPSSGADEEAVGFFDILLRFFRGAFEAAEVLGGLFVTTILYGKSEINSW